MDNLTEEINAFVRRHPPPDIPTDTTLSVADFRQLGFTPRILFPVAAPETVAKAEAQFGFGLPPLLVRIYTEVSNGIAGFSYNMMGLEGGCASDLGTLVETYLSFKSDDDDESRPWQAGLLPFCDWGCAIYSCVDCTDPGYRIFTYEDSGAWPEPYSLSGFFEQWLRGNVDFSQEGVEVLTREIINPFTGKPSIVSSRKRRKQGL